MACLNMQVKNETQGEYLMGPRISFSTDFIDSNNHHENSYTEAPVSSDFEFSVPTLSLNSADEVFFKAAGKLPPLKEKVVVTLRDELLADDDGDVMFFKTYKNSKGWWRDKFGLRKCQNKNLGGLQTIDETKIKPNFTG
ncbi:hypothetical protein HanPI659440_Chr16g0618921 [Helianthus annuus]|nr:hypothetical protein HanPI659440_Chr16g0618921 [Helianthus annuus]